MLIFGLCFELPVVVMALVKLDILSYKVMKSTRAWAAVGICVVSAVVAPSPDVFTLLLIAAPLYALYEICIWLAWWLDKRDRVLYPDHYKLLEEDEKAVEADDWDNESYNPWSGHDDDEEDVKPSKPSASPPGTQPLSEPPVKPADTNHQPDEPNHDANKD